MKNCIVLVFGISLLASPALHATLIYYDGFSNPVGSDLDQQSGWIAYNNTSPTSDQMVSGSLSIPGFAVPQGNSVELVSNGKGGETSFATQTADTWFSFLINVNSTASLGPQDAVGGFVQSGTTVGGTFYIRADGAAFDIGGQDNQSGSIQWNTNASLGFPTGQTALIVGQYELSSGPFFNVWMFSSASATWGNNPPGSAIQISGGSRLSSISGFYFDSTADIQVDELRIGTTYASVTPVPEPGSVALLVGISVLGAGILFRRKINIESQ